MLRKDPKLIYKYQFESMLKKKGITTNYEIMEFIFNDDNGFQLMDLYLENPKTTVINRLNSIWVYPIYLLTIAPYRYIMNGDTGVSRNSKLGMILAYLLGEYY